MSPRTIGLVPKAKAFLNLSTQLSCSVVKNAFSPLNGAPKTNLKSNDFRLPPLLTNRCLCSLGRRLSIAPTFFINLNKFA